MPGGNTVQLSITLCQAGADTRSVPRFPAPLPGSGTVGAAMYANR
jgi:hypothetical protein